ncbi:MAG: hypothetical protein U1A78_34815 [Polyangia bacterium]
MSGPLSAGASLGADPQRTDVLAALLRAQRKSRIAGELLWRLFAEAFPTRPHGPSERQLLCEVLEVLAERGVVRLPSMRSRRLWDDTARPGVPRQLRVLRPATPAVDRAWRQFPWHRRLSWVADLPVLSDEHASFLRKVHEGLVADRFTQVAPLKYRSLELTGHEKRLARLAASQLFGLGRLTLDLLGCADDPLPLVWEAVGPRPTLILFENSSSFSVARSVLAQLPDPPYGLVAYGAGTRIERSLPYLRTLSRQVLQIDYVGDLDRDGLRIALATQRAAAKAGLPIPRPAAGLHRLMLEACRAFGHPRGWPHRKKRITSAQGDADLLAFLPADVREDVAPILAADRRIPEEVLGPQQLSVLWHKVSQASPSVSVDKNINLV